ncbi:hypothetical protein D7S86_10525 [Pararobbsia silviterrae]|uniref:Uncharacterized protein n=2 Tax=Pararobbsia silviterrae TaxID=1792498 RepID=A0A494Y6V2_9BURK|nr:hypothetical protein D7S86_10525 [Pararobbsia silviterrae]
MQQQTQRTTVKAAAATTPAASVAHMVETARERDVDDAMDRSRYCDPRLARLLHQAPEGSAIHMGAETQRADVKR